MGRQVNAIKGRNGTRDRGPEEKSKKREKHNKEEGKGRALEPRRPKVPAP